MSKFAFPIRVLAVVGAIVVALVLASPMNAVAPLYQVTPEPGTRPPPTSSPYIEVDPTQAVAQNDIPITVNGFFWSTAAPNISLYWDIVDDAHRIFGPQSIVQADGTFQAATTVPLALATTGTHTVIAVDDTGFSAEATIELLPPSPLPPATLSLNPTQGVAGDETVVQATGTWFNRGAQVTLYWDDTGTVLATGQVNNSYGFQIQFTTPTAASLASVGSHEVLAIDSGGRQATATFQLIAPTPISPTPTSSPTPTPTPSPTLAPLTPIITITPVVPTKKPTSAVTKAPTRTRTPTPIPGTATDTPTPSVTPTVTDTPGPGTPSVTPEPTETPTPTRQAVDEISDTGGGWGTVFLWGFVLAGLLVVFRLLRVRGLEGPR